MSAVPVNHSRTVDFKPGDGAALLDETGASDETESALHRTTKPWEVPGERAQEGAASLRADPAGRVGPYRILKVLGEGGMGTVYLAEQREPIRRRVALKVIRRGAVAPDEVRRFEVERQALALMNHPNIAQVFDAGTTEDGEPYLAMEYVPGPPITDYCDNKRLSVRQRLELFLEVCEGMQHAHQKRILHRDIKPSNVLVTETLNLAERDRPVVKVIDFGVAKSLDQPLTDETLYTGAWLIGTPPYWSPEMVLAARGGLDIDTRSDVYALGVLLYQLLAGVLPFTADNVMNLLGAITDEEPMSPSRRLASLDEETRETTAAQRRRSRARALAAALEGDLDWICLRAIAKERSRRYGSVAELAADVERHLAHLPVVASPPSPIYRAHKFFRRNLAWVVPTALMVLALLGGLVARTREAERANREAEASRQISEFLIELFEVSDPGEARGSTITAREILGRGAERIRGELVGQPLTHARLLDTIGKVYSQLGLYEPAAPLLEEALGLRQQHLGKNHLHVASSLFNLGFLYEEQGDYEGAETLYRQALAIRERALGEEHPEVAQALRSLANIYRFLGRYEEAETLFQQALAINERLSGPDDVGVAESLRGLATINYIKGDYEESEALYRRALVIKERALGKDHPEIADYLNNLANIYFQQNRYELAADFYERALKLGEQALGPDHPEVATDSVNLALVYQEQNRFSEAEAIYRRALPSLEKALGQNHPRVAHCMTNLADLHRRQGRPEEAERLLVQSLAIFEKALGSDHFFVADSLFGLAQICLEQERFREAEGFFQRVLAIREKVNHPGHPELLEAVRDYATLLRATGREEEATSLEVRFESARPDR